MSTPFVITHRAAAVVGALTLSLSACATHRFTEPKAKHLAYVQTFTEPRWMADTRVLRCGRSYEVGIVSNGLVRDFGEVFPPDSPAREIGEEAERQSRVARGFWIAGLLTQGVGAGVALGGALQTPYDETMLWTGVGIVAASIIPILIGSTHQMKARVAFEDAIATYNDAAALDPSVAQCDTYTWPDPPEALDTE